MKSREETLHLKRELVNREENFNQRFSSSPPNFGVTKVVKSKRNIVPPLEEALRYIKVLRANVMDLIGLQLKHTTIRRILS